MVLVSTCSHIVYIVSCRCVFREESNYRFILPLQFSYIICILVLCSVAIVPKQSYSTKVESNFVIYIYNIYIILIQISHI